MVGVGWLPGRFWLRDGHVFQYQSKHRPGRFVIAFPTAEEIDDISLDLLLQHGAWVSEALEVHHVAL